MNTVHFIKPDIGTYLSWQQVHVSLVRQVLQDLAVPHGKGQEALYVQLLVLGTRKSHHLVIAQSLLLHRDDLLHKVDVDCLVMGQVLVPVDRDEANMTGSWVDMGDLLVDLLLAPVLGSKRLGRDPLCSVVVSDYFHNG